MPEAGNDLKSSKPRRLLNKGDIPLARQVHYDNLDAKSRPGADPSNNTEEAPKNTQPDSHPQVGQPPLPNLNRPPSDQWFTAVDPTRSLHLPGSQSVGGHFPLLHQHLPPYGNFHQQAFIQTVPGVSAVNMGDYQNCVPPPTGVNFQPPVPDTTFGPIPHVYVPRFDGGPVYAGGGVHQPIAAAPPSYVVQPGMMAMAQQPVMLNGQAYVPAYGPGMPTGQPMMSAAGIPAPMMATSAAPVAAGPIPIFPAQPVYH